MVNKSRVHGNMFEAIFAVICVLVVVSAGCQTLGPGDSRQENCSLWPVLDAEKSEGVNEDGSRWIKENGDALLVAHWNNHRTYDKDGLLIKCDDYSEIWPLFEARNQVNNGSKNASGRILLFFKYGNSEDISN